MTNNPAQVPSKLNNIAVLIDADNTSAKSIGDILKKIATIGTIGCKKAFGDWGCAHLQSWQSELLSHAIEPVQQFAFIKGKNATDIAMVIEAMDLLYSQEFDGFCLISSDSDFTPLAIRIRKNKARAIGFGKRNTNDAFIQACDNFYFIEYLSQPTETPTPTPTPKISGNRLPSQAVATSSVVQAWTENQLKCDTKLLNGLRDAVSNHPKTAKDGWVNAGLVGKKLQEVLPKFDAKYYGYSKFTDIVRTIDLFETKANNSTLYIRLKPKVMKVNPVLSATSSPPTSSQWSTEKLQKQTHFISVIDKLIKENPTPDNGWTNLSYVVSQIRQHHPNINWKKYGFAKFSELLLALDIYNIRRKDNGIFIQTKQKNLPAASQPQKTKRAQNQPSVSKQPQPTFTGFNHDSYLTIDIYASSKAEVALICHNDNDFEIAEDIICPNQRFSIDSAILLTPKTSSGITKSRFSCNFNKISTAIYNLSFILKGKIGYELSHGCPIIEVYIYSRGNLTPIKRCFDVSKKEGKNFMLFSLKRDDLFWKLLPKNTYISDNLPTKKTTKPVTEAL